QLAASPDLGRYLIEIGDETVVRRAGQVLGLGAGQQRRTFIDLIEGVGAEHQGVGVALHQSLGKGEQGLAGTGHRQYMTGGLPPASRQARQNAGSASPLWPDAGQARRRWWGRPNTGPSPGPGYPARSREPRAWVHRWTATPDSGRDCRPRPRATPAASRRGRAAAVAGRCSCSDIHAQWRIVIRLVDVVAESTNDGALQALAQLGIGQGLVVRIGQYENIIHTLTQRDDACILHA